MDSGSNIANHLYVIELEKVNEILKQTLVSFKETTQKSAESYKAKIQELEDRITWFVKQIHGAKSERREYDDDTLFPKQSEQLKLLALAEQPAIVQEVPAQATTPRKKSFKVIPIDNASQSGLRYSKELEVVDVPVANPVTKGLAESEYTVISERVAEKLCQRKSSYYIKRYKQKVIKLKESGEIIQDGAPEKVILSAQADLSLLVGMTVDKFVYHLPLYRQHLRMAAQGITISRASLTLWVHDFIDLFEPIYDVLQKSILAGQLISMDETPHKAGRSNGKMDQCYYWFLYGQLKEVYIHHNASRGKEVIKQLLMKGFTGTLLSDGYPAYDAIAEELQLIHANCMAHARRKFIEAEEQEPVSSKQAVALIRQMYEKEEKAPKDDRQKRLDYRLREIKPLVDEFFDWLELESARLTGLPGTKYSEAVNYALTRKASLSVFLTNPDVPIDNNHTERAVRPLVMGRKNYLFCWSEVGAEKVAIIQSIILTCQLNGIDPWEYLTDVAPQIAKDYSKAALLTPRLWHKARQEKEQQQTTAFAQAA